MLDEPGNGCALFAARPYLCKLITNVLFITLMRPQDVFLVCPASWLYHTEKMCLKFEEFLKDLENLGRKYNISLMIC